jgi:hypothetical protein
MAGWSMGRRGALAVVVSVVAAGAAVPSGDGARAAVAADPYARVWSGCQKSGLVAGRDGTVPLRACFRGAQLVAIEEQPAGRPRLRYFYADGRPAAFRGAYPASGVAVAGAAPAPTVPVAIDWRADGAPSRAVRIEHFGEVRLGDAEVRAALTRAEALAAAALPPGAGP